MTFLVNLPLLQIIEVFFIAIASFFGDCEGDGSLAGEDEADGVGDGDVSGLFAPTKPVLP